MNIYELFRERSRQGTDFILSPDLEPLYSYEDMHRESGRYARLLQAMGVRPGDRIAVQVEKSPACLFLYFGCLRAGAVYLPLNTAYLDHELQYFCEDAEPRLVVCSSGSESRFESIGMTTRTLDADGSGSLPAALGDEVEFETTDRADDDIAVILYTSGTTGRPKGAMISHGNLAVNALTLFEAWQWRAADVMLHALPIFHIHGLFVATHLPLLGGCPIIFLPAFNAAQVIELLPHASVYMGVPTNYTRLIGTGLLNPEACRNMRLFTSGSAPLLQQTFDEFTKLTGHRIVERYGMTETGMNTSNPIDGERKPGTVGPPLPGVETRVVDGDGNDLPPGEPGNLLVRGPNVFHGYWKLPEKTREEFTDEGFFRTGDIAAVDEDGYIAIVGRNKDMIITGGLNVYPKEIESEIDKLPGVLESAVIGLPHADFGEGVCAIIVPEPGIEPDGEAIRTSLKGLLAGFKVPKWIYFTDQLPRNTMGKVQKNRLREMYPPPP